jgi:hypothetical protein
MLFSWRLNRFMMAACMLFAPVAITAQEQQAPSLEQLLAKHFEAMGALDKLASVKTTKMTIVIDRGNPWLQLKYPGIRLFESKQLGFTLYHSKSYGIEHFVATTPEGGWVSSTYKKKMSTTPESLILTSENRRLGDLQ